MRHVVDCVFKVQSPIKVLPRISVVSNRDTNEGVDLTFHNVLNSL